MYAALAYMHVCSKTLENFVGSMVYWESRLCMSNLTLVTKISGSEEKKPLIKAKFSNFKKLNELKPLLKFFAQHVPPGKQIRTVRIALFITWRPSLGPRPKHNLQLTTFACYFNFLNKTFRNNCCESMGSKMGIYKRYLSGNVHSN